MTNPIHDTQATYFEQVSLGCLAIHTPLQTTKSLFVNREQYEILYTYKQKKEITLEIRFDSSTLTCLFDSDNICKSVFLFMDDIRDIIRYIEYCNETFPVDTALKGWVANNRIIQINTENKTCSLLILPIEKIVKS